MNQKGFTNIALIVLLVILAGTVGYFALVKKATTPPKPEPGITNTPVRQQPVSSQVGCDKDNNSRLKIINEFSNNWPEFEKNIQPRPVLGSTAWITPNDYQFIGNSRMFIAFEDGHVVLASIIQYKCDKDSIKEFSNLEIFVNDYPFNETKWNNLYSQYGDKNFGVHSYTQSIFKGGKLVRYDSWTEVPENLFIWHPKGY